MIQIYNPENENFKQNGDMTLLPEEALVHVILNGMWEAVLIHKIDEEGRWKYIQENSVVKMPSFNGEQLFRIKRKVKKMSGIEATMVPIFMDAKEDCMLVDVRPTNKNGQQALDIMTAPNRKYSGKSDILKIATAYYETKNLIEAINSEDENSFVNRWGGEILFDNHTILINKRVGGSYGVQILYGKNISGGGFEEKVDMQNVVTRIIPKAYNGHMMSGNKPWVDSQYINKYPTVKYAVVKFDDVKLREDAQEDDEEKEIVICDTQSELDHALTKKCAEQFKTGIDKPAINISADIVLIENTKLYEDIKGLEKVALGDTVCCKHSVLDIVTEARVIELKYDSIRRKTSYVCIGDFKYDYFQNISSVINRVESTIREDGSIIAEQVHGIINAMNASLQLQSTVAKKIDGRAFLIEDLDKLSALFGAMEAGTQGFRISKKRAADGRSWVWTTAITALGIIADAIVTGSITSRNWKENEAGFRFNLDEGTINSKHLKLDLVGLLTIYKALIQGGELTLGGADGKDGVIHIKDDTGKEIGTWDKNGLDVKSGDISGTKITLGGNGNKDGILQLLDGLGGILVTLTNEGVYAKGKYICGSDKYGRKIEISDGAFKILDKDGNEVGKLFAVSNNMMRLECGKVAIRFTQEMISLDADQIAMNGFYGKTGRMEFSDGTYVDLESGMIIGGNTKEGAF